MVTKDYYSVLQVLPTAEDVVIKAAYKALAQKYHPDRYRDDPAFAQAKMEALNEAYRVLSDPEERQSYHRDLAGGGANIDQYFEEWVRAFTHNWQHGD